MKAAVVLGGLSAQVDRWFSAPEVNAAGRLGLYRIFFCLFYLGYLGSNAGLDWSTLYQADHLYLWLIAWIPAEWLLPNSFALLESFLVAAVVLLLLGAFVPITTALVLCLGVQHEACVFAVDGTRATVLLTGYIPLFMLLSCHWGKTYSIDAFVSSRNGSEVRVEPSDSSWRYNLAARAVLVVLAALFLSGAISKVAFGGTWLSEPELFAHILLDKNVNAAIAGVPLNPLAPFVAQHTWLQRSSALLVV